jgi:hypothetical protein
MVGWFYFSRIVGNDPVASRFMVSPKRHDAPVGDTLTIMSIPEDTPLKRAQAKLEQIESQLRKCPDFQLYLLARSPIGRARMKRLLMEIPSFRLWYPLRVR